jgi:hypothetical protein
MIEHIRVACAKMLTDDWSDPLPAARRNFYKVEKWINEDGSVRN